MVDVKHFFVVDLIWKVSVYKMVYILFIVGSREIVKLGGLHQSCDGGPTKV